MNITKEKKGDINVLHVNGRLDTTNYSDLEDMLVALTENNEINILLDLSSLEYISSSGLRILLKYLKVIKAVKGRFMLCALTNDIREIFEISGFINIFEIFEDQATALKS